MSPIANPLVQGMPAGSAAAADPTGGDQADTLYAAGGQAAAAGGFQGMGTFSGSLTAPHNTSAQVGVLVAIALGVIVLLHVGGFRFAVDAGLTGR
jgi:hypothetical protein